MVVTTHDVVGQSDPAAAVEPADDAAEEAPDYDSDGDGKPDRPDRVSAALLAAEFDEPVEDMSARTESATEVVNPDGTVTSEDFGGPVRVVTETIDPETGETVEDWEPVDYTLTELPGGRWAPKTSPAEVVVNGVWNGRDEAARVTFEDGSAVAITWPTGTAGLDGDGDGVLPTPVIDGATATYPLEGYSGSVDLVIGMTTAGVTALLRINEELTPAETAIIEAQGVTFGINTIGTHTLTTGTDAVAADPDLATEVPGGGVDNALVLTDAEGALVAATPELQAWEDSVVDDMGVPAETVTLEADLTTVGATGTGANRVTAHELTVTPPDGFLTDTATEYPVVLDPEIQSLTQTQDTWVRNGIGGTNGSDASLLVGKANAWPNNPAHSFLLFNGHSLTGRSIVKAELGLYQYQAGSCGAKTMNIHAVSGTWTESTMTWGNQPGVHGTDFTAITANRGLGCTTGMGYTTANVTRIVQAWANYQANNATFEGYINRGFRLAAPSNGDKTFERRFCSMNFNSTTAAGCVGYNPYLKVTYNNAPKVAALPRMPAAVGMSWPESDGSLTYHVPESRPTFETNSVDDDGTDIYHFIEARTSSSSPTIAASCTAEPVRSGEVARCKFGTSLANNQTYLVRAKGYNFVYDAVTDTEVRVDGPWSQWRRIRVNATAPQNGTANSCGDYTSGTFYAQRPSPTATCTFSFAGAAQVKYEVNGKQYQTVNLGSSTTSTVTFPVAEAGWTSLRVQALSSSGRTAPTLEYGWGIGEAALNEPVADTTSSTTIPVQGSGPSGATSAKVQWRLAPTTEGDTTTGWTDATNVVVAETGSAWSGTLSSSAGSSIAQTPRLLWDTRSVTDMNLGAVVQVRIQFNYTGGTKYSPFERVHVVKSAFGANFPTQEVGPATVALATGEVSLGGSDIEAPGYAEAISIGRNHLSLAGETTGPQSVYGPGWIGDFAGPDFGVAGYTIDDRTALDGTFQIANGDGNTDAYAHSSGTRGALKVGTYVGVGDTALLENKVTLEAVTGTAGVTHRLTIVDVDKTTSIFERISTGTGYTWVTRSVRGPENNSTTTYAYNADGTTAWIVAPAPTGVTCSVQPTVNLPVGCRALEMIYTGTGTGPSGTKRLTEVKLHIYDPKTGSNGLPGTGAGMTAISVAKYSYNSDNELTATWDPRLGDGTAALKTEFELSDVTVGSSTKKMVTKFTEPGLEPWSFSYDTQGRLETVTRALDPDTTGYSSSNNTATWRVKYNVGLNGDGRPDLRAEATATWGQPAEAAPAYATAVFEPDYTGGANPSTDGWSYATISYFDAKGRTTNTATYGAGQWLVDSTRYDTQNNVVWQLDAEGRDRALAVPEGSTATSAERAESYASQTIYNTAGTRVEATISPAREVVLDDGTEISGHTVVETVYDDEADAALMPGRPTTGVPEDGFGLKIEERTSIIGSPDFDDTTPRLDTTRTRYRYDPLVAGDADGWAISASTHTLVEDASISGGWAVSITRSNSDGLEIESRSAGVVADGGTGATSSDPRTTQTIYYTADDSAVVTACRNKPQWVGQVCLVRPGGAPASGPAVPTESTTGYSMLLSPTRVEASSGSTARVVVTQLDAKQRPSIINTTIGSDTLTSTTTYTGATSAVASVSMGASTETMTYDTWGRVRTRTGGSGNVSVTNYDAAGRIASFQDGKGQYTYTYDGTDALGKAERRGLITAVDTGYASSSSDDVITAAYNHDGKPVRQIYPGGYTAASTYDMDGNTTGLSYTRTSGSTTTTLVGFTQTHDHRGRVSSIAGPTGTTSYTYDTRGRLSASTQVTADNNPVCANQSYTFTTDSNRKKLTTTIKPGSDCAATATSTTVSDYTYDGADRITGSTGATAATGYVYDALGRTTTLPVGHTNLAGVTGAGNVTATYQPNDMVKTLTQTIPNPSGSGTVVRSQTFSLDAIGRISTTTTSNDSTALAESTHYYAGDADTSAWTSTKTRPDANTAWTTKFTRNVQDVEGNLALTVNSDGAVGLYLRNPHGDFVATVALSETNNVVAAYTDYTDYGSPTSAAQDSVYGWLGQHRRESNNIVGGLSLMGARLYNPVIGRFMSRDSVRDGNDNVYIYPADPINEVDLNGKWRSCVRNWRRCAANGVSRVTQRAVRWTQRNWRPATAALLSVGYWRANQALGSRCSWQRRLMVCRGPLSLSARGGTTIGFVFSTRSRSNSPRYLMHERRHTRQWFREGLPMAWNYFSRKGWRPCNNRYERNAGWADGGYDECLQRRR